MRRGTLDGFRTLHYPYAQLLIATTFALGMLTSVSQAYTPEQEQMCTGDAMRLCSRRFRMSIVSLPA
jgi:hypothetical protein